MIALRCLAVAAAVALALPLPAQEAKPAKPVAKPLPQVESPARDFAPIAAALNEINFSGYLSAEALPYPDSDQAAKLTIEAFRKICRVGTAHRS